MVSRNATMIMFATDGTSNQTNFFNNYNENWDFQDLYADETHPSGSNPSDKIYNMAGKSKTINTRAFSPGIYFIKFQNQLTEKFIVAP